VLPDLGREVFEFAEAIVLVTEATPRLALAL
jgi:hypothetical protein